MCVINERVNKRRKNLTHDYVEEQNLENSFFNSRYLNLLLLFDYAYYIILGKQEK